ncbi:efflux transporter outer membrane subunit [Candidatus Nitrotoga fabula]|uniref:Outer membrane protein OprM n=1 Tax=Candidatus Nitrotoga fabula TaxID=2182327 RepID=A0A916BFU8_9PROT|nr:efflux transporter outer membrane subunit [Candidatus Nitrotoga fabula]CAE6708429.1 Outer membrane protein OprM [Candidatus Nitrotoga fabula]
MSIKVFFVSLLAFLVLAGCTIMPEYVPPSLPTATTFPRSTPETAGISVANTGWKSYFGDEQLRELISSALSNNRELLLAVSRVEEVRALYGIQHSNLLPSFSGNASATRLRLPTDVLPIQPGTANSFLLNQYQLSFALSTWEIDFWGRLRSLDTAALETYLSTDEARHAVRASLIAQVANSYLVECELSERIDLARSTLQTRQDSLRIAKRRFEVGSAARLDAIQAEILLNQARAELAVLQRMREQNHNGLELLVGGSIPARPHLLSRIEAGFVRSIDVGLPSDLLVQRPDLRAAERHLKAANANIGAARAAFFPRIVLTGSLGVASRELDGLFSGSGSAWNFMPSISLPIFDGGRNQANLDLAYARRNSAVVEYERRVQNAFREVADVLAERYWLSEQIQAQKATLIAQRERSRLASLRYQHGTTNYLEVLDAERSLFAVEQMLVITRRAYLASGVMLYAALGGGGGILDEGV